MNFQHIFSPKRKFVQKLSKKGPKTGVVKKWNFDFEGPLASRLIPGAGNEPQDRIGPQNDPKMTSKLPQNGTVGIRNHSNTLRHLRVGWNRKCNPKVVSEII